MSSWDSPMYIFASLSKHLKCWEKTKHSQWLQLMQQIPHFWACIYSSVRLLPCTDLQKRIFFPLIWCRGCLSVMVWLLQHKILPKTRPWMHFVQGQFTPAFQRSLNPPHSSQSSEPLWVYKTGVMQKIPHGASVFNVLGLWSCLNPYFSYWSSPDLNHINVDLHWCTIQKFIK